MTDEAEPAPTTDRQAFIREVASVDILALAERSHDYANSRDGSKAIDKKTKDDLTARIAVIHAIAQFRFGAKAWDGAAHVLAAREEKH